MADVSERDRQVIDAYFGAMRAGQSGSDDMMNLFADDAVYVEPFRGAAAVHTGKDAIRRNYAELGKQSPPDMHLTLDRVELNGDAIRTVWTCTSPAFPGPMRGQDLWTIVDGKIARLETSMLPD